MVNTRGVFITQLNIYYRAFFRTAKFPKNFLLKKKKKKEEIREEFRAKKKKIREKLTAKFCEKIKMPKFETKKLLTIFPKNLHRKCSTGF